MKLLFAVRGLPPDYVGGAPRHSFRLIKHLAQIGVQIDVIHPLNKIYYDELPNVKEYAIAHGNIGSSYYKNVATFLENHSVTYTFGYSDGFSLWLYLKRRKFPCIFNHHGFHMFQDQDFGNYFRYAKTRAIKDGIKDAIRRHIVRYNIDHSDYVVSVSKTVRNILQNQLGVKQSKIIDLPEAVPTEFIPEKRKNNEKIPNSFLFVGNIEYRKGLTYLIKAFNQLKKNVKLFIVGDGYMRKTLRRLQEDEKVKFLGKISEKELHNWYSKAECFILPSLIEGGPIVVLEAMAHSLPVIATDVGAIKEFVNASNGFIVPPGKVNSLKVAIRKFYNLDVEVKRQMGKTSRRIVKNKFTWDKVAQNFYEDLRNLIKAKAHRQDSKRCLEGFNG